MAEARTRALALTTVVVGLAVAAIVWALLEAQRLPSAAEPLAWSRVACARCRMLVSEPEFAAQLHERDGSVWYFDDPGCLLLWRSELRPDVHAVWLRHYREDRWLGGDAVRFLPVEPTPMGYGLGATDEIDALSWEDARAWALSRDAARDAGGDFGG